MQDKKQSNVSKEENFICLRYLSQMLKNIKVRYVTDNKKLVVKNIIKYVGQPPLPNSTERGSNVWGYNFTLSSST